MKQFDHHPKAFLFGTHTGARVTSFKKAAIELFGMVGLKFGRGKGQYRIHDARHETISALSQSREFNDALKQFTGIRADRTLARYRHLENMDVAVLAANVLDERSAAQEAEGVLAPFMRKGWSIEQRRRLADPAWSTPMRRSPTFSGAPTTDLTRARVLRRRSASAFRISPTCTARRVFLRTESVAFSQDVSEPPLVLLVDLDKPRKQVDGTGIAMFVGKLSRLPHLFHDDELVAIRFLNHVVQ